MPVGEQVAVPAQYRFGAHEQSDAVQDLAGQRVQQGGEKRPVGRGELDLLAVQLPLQDGDLVTQREISASLALSLMGSRRSSASVLLTPR